MVLGAVVVIEIVLIYFKVRADVFNRIFSAALSVFLIFLAGEAVVTHVRAREIWPALRGVLVALGIFVPYHVIFGGVFLAPFAASAYFGSLAWSALNNRPASCREAIGGAAALFVSGTLMLPLPALFVHTWPVVTSSLVASALLSWWGGARLGRASAVRDPVGAGALAFFAGIWLSAGVLIFRAIAGYME